MIKRVEYANQATTTVLRNKIILSVVVRVIYALNRNFYSYKVDAIIF